jgi:hypothetical protein
LRYPKQLVSAQSSIRRGFEAVLRQPALLLAEITWRGCFAAAAWLLAVVAILEYLNAVPVSGQEQALLRSGNLLLAVTAVSHALRGSAARLAGSMVVAGTAVAILWMLCAALGRLVTLKALLPEADGAYRPLLGLSFLRAGLFLAAVLAAAGALILADFAGPLGDAAPSVVLAALLMGCIWLVWALLNWLLSLASIFAVRDRQDTFGAIAAAVDLVRKAFGEVVLTSLPFVLLHYAALAAAVVSGVLVSDLRTRVSPEAGWALVAIAAGYFAYADFLYITRLSSYVALAGPGAEAHPVPEHLPPPELTLPASEAGALGLKTPESRLPTPDY